MIVGIPLETKQGERRVALLPRAVEELKAAGHDVRVETRAGVGAGFDDTAYREAGADIVVAKDVWDSDLIVKVKEVQEADLAIMPRGATIFAFHHLPGEPGRTRELAAKGATAIAFEMVRDARGQFPLLAPMSKIAARLGVEHGMALLGATKAGERRRALVLGAGNAGMSAARAASRLKADVVILTRSKGSVEDAKDAGFKSFFSTPENIEQYALASDLIVGAVFIAGQPTPKLLPRELVKRMKQGSVIVDFSIDAGGIAETSRPTTHEEPCFIEEGVIHCCIPNIPAADPQAASKAISEAALPYVLDMASHESFATAIKRNPELREAVLLWQGNINHEGIATEAWLPYTPLTDTMLAES